MAEFASTLHDSTEHLIVTAPCEEYLAREKLKESAAHRPNINAEIVGHAENLGTVSSKLEKESETLTDFRRSVESTD